MIYLQKVRARIVKRFSLYKQREKDEVGDVNFEELKQDLQMVRFEMLNDLKRSREETIRMVSQLHTGVALIGEEIYRGQDNEASRKFMEYHELTETGFYDGNSQKNASSDPHSPSISHEATDLTRNKIKLSNEKKHANDTNKNSLGSSLDKQSQSTLENVGVNLIKSNSFPACGETIQNSQKCSSNLSETRIEFEAINNGNSNKIPTFTSMNVLDAINEEENCNVVNSCHK